MAKDKVVIDIVAKDDTKKGVDKATKSFSNMAKTLGPLITAGFGIAVVKAVTDAFVRQEDAIAQLDARLKSTGNTVGFTSQQLQNMASSLQGVTKFGDEAIIEMQSLLLTFTKIGGETFPQATEAILNVSTAMGQDLQSAAIQVGKALNDPVKGVTALQRSGIQFTDSQKDMIKTLVESGDVIGAQTIILKELETQFGGAARAAKETLGGALQSAENDMGDLAESVGSILAPKLKELANLASDVAVSLREMIDPTLQGDLREVNEEIEAMGGLLNDMAAEGVAENQIAFVEGQIDALVAKRVALEQQINEINNPTAQQQEGGPVGGPGGNQGEQAAPLNVHLAIQEANQIEDVWLQHFETMDSIRAMDDAAQLSQSIAQGQTLTDVWQQQANDRVEIEAHADATMLSNKLLAQQALTSALSSLSSLMNSESKKAFEIGKAASIAQASINTFESATGAYKSLAGIPIVGPALGAAAAIAAGIAGFANVKKIANTKFGGGAGGSPSVPSSGGSGGAGGGPGGDIPPLTALNPGQAPQAAGVGAPVIINNNPGLIGEWIDKELGPALLEAQTRGVTIIVE